MLLLIFSLLKKTIPSSSPDDHNMNMTNGNDIDFEQNLELDLKVLELRND